MSLRKNSISIASSLNTIIKNNSKNSRHLFFSISNYTPIRHKFHSKRKLNLQGSESSTSNKFKNSKTNKKRRFSNPSLFLKKKESPKHIFYNPSKKIDFKILVKSIKSNFFNKYNGIYYDNTIYSFNSNMNQYTYFSYYLINDLINGKRFHYASLLKEYSILYNQQEILFKYYKKNERYIIMKYLLNFVYKYDESSYNINKEIKDKEIKEKLVETFHHITSNQYLYEHLLDTDSLQGIKFILRRINLTNKKAQYDYSYLELAKNRILSEENKYIINAIKIVNEFMNNIKYLEKSLIKNLPLEKVPNIIPNYFALGFELNMSLKKYLNIKKYYKKIKPTDETKKLINNYTNKFSNTILYNNNLNYRNKNVLFNEKKDLLDVDDAITEIESSLFDHDNYENYEKILSKNRKYKKGVYSPNDFHNLLPLSLYEPSDKDKPNNFSRSKRKRSTKESIINYKLLYDNFNDNNPGKRLTRDPEIVDIENFLYLFPKDIIKEKKFNSFNKKKPSIKYNIRNQINIKDDDNILNSDNRLIKLKSSFRKKNTETKIKFKGVTLKLEDDSNKNKKSKFLINSPNNNNNNNINNNNNNNKSNNTLGLFLNKDNKNININQINSSQSKNNINNIKNSIRTNKRYKTPKIIVRKSIKNFTMKNNNNNHLILSNKKSSSNLIDNHNNNLNQNLFSNIRHNRRLFSFKNASIKNVLLKINSNNSISNNKKMNNISCLNKKSNMSINNSLNKSKSNNNNNNNNKNNSIGVSKSLNINDNNSNKIKSEQKINNKKYNNKKKYRIFSFKETNDFINGFNHYYNRIKVKPNLLLNNLSLYNKCKKYFLGNKSNEFGNNSSTKRILSSNNNNNNNNDISIKSKTKEKSFFNENSNYSMEKISNYMKNQLNKSKQKNNKNITFKQILKNSEFYSCEL